MANYPQTLADLQGFIGTLINDPTNTRYSITEINSILDIVQDDWNLECHIVRDTVTLTVVAGTNTYAISTLTGTLMKLLRVTHKGIDLKKRSKDYFDMFASYDWTSDNGTPNDYFIDLNLANPVIGVRPTPQSNDAGAFLKVEYVKRHTPMVLPTDTPFMNGTTQNALIMPYAYGVAYEAAWRLLQPDPTAEIVKKVADFKGISTTTRSIVVQIYREFDADEPWKMHGGRNWVY